MHLDKDLKSLQEVRELCRMAKEAQAEFRQFSQERVDKVVAAMAEAGYYAAEDLARQAVSETRYGRVKDKVTKNQFCTRDLYESIRQLRTVGIIEEDRKRRILKVAEPMGVVAAIIPTTNPTSTAMFKSIISVKARNGVVISPHPRAANCILHAARIVGDAATAAGAPKHLIGAIQTPTLQATQELMQHPDIDVILATGGSAMVRSAYSSGKPAYGVGPGNVPAYIDRSADYRKAVADVIAGTTFDYGTLCSSEQALIVHESILPQVRSELVKRGAHFMNADEISKLGRILVSPEFRINPEMVGQSPQVLASAAGFKMPDGVTVLIGELAGVGKAHPLSAEKLSPVLAYYDAANHDEAIKRSVEILNFGGRGHTAVVHARNDSVIREFGQAVPAFRVVVNSPASLGAVGYTNRLMPSMTLGCGSYGGNITSDNITAHHLMNIKRIAFETKPLSVPRNGKDWHPSVFHDWQRKDIPYNKVFSTDVSRKGVSLQESTGWPPASSSPRDCTPAPPRTHTATADKVEQIVDEFIRNRS